MKNNGNNGIGATEKARLARALGGGLSRREFMRRAAALGIAAPTASAFLGGLGEFGQAARAATPKKGGVFRYGLAGGSTTDTLDPGGITDFFMQSLSSSIRGELTEIDHNNGVIPQIAESWEAADGAKTWRFKIRRRRGISQRANGETLRCGRLHESPSRRRFQIGLQALFCKHPKYRH